jgi:hypothetical protein
MPHELKFENVKIVENGPVRATISADASYDKSKIKVLVCCLLDLPVLALILGRSRWTLSLVRLYIFLYFRNRLIVSKATTKSDARSAIVFDASIDWHQRHELLKCRSLRPDQA